MLKQIMAKLVPSMRCGCLAIGFILTGCSSGSLIDKHVEWETVTPASFPQLKAVGYAPISLQPGESESQKMIMAIRASKLDAYRELTEQVYGQNIRGATSIQAMVAQNDRLKARVDGLIRGAKVIKTYALDDVYATELELDMALVYQLQQVQQQQRKIKKVHYY